MAATNRNLEEMVIHHTFRQDLYYRLNVIPMEMPPLREREDDIIILAQHFLRHYNSTLHKNIHGFDYESQMLLMAYSWPGNIRELKNLIEFFITKRLSINRRRALRPHFRTAALRPRGRCRRTANRP